MRRTLRRSCDACARAKHKCDLHTPRCSRCTSRQLQCDYANEPVSALDSPKPSAAPGQTSRSCLSTMSVTIGSSSFDPFDSYPSTSLPRARVQGLIVHCTLLRYPSNYWHMNWYSQSCPRLPSSIILWTLTPPRTPSSIVGGRWPWRIQHYSMSRCRQPH